MFVGHFGNFLGVDSPEDMDPKRFACEHQQWAFIAVAVQLGIHKPNNPNGWMVKSMTHLHRPVQLPKIEVLTYLSNM